MEKKFVALAKIIEKKESLSQTGRAVLERFNTPSFHLWKKEMETKRYLAYTSKKWQLALQHIAVKNPVRLRQAAEKIDNNRMQWMVDKSSCDKVDRYRAVIKEPIYIDEEDLSYLLQALHKPYIEVIDFQIEKEDNPLLGPLFILKKLAVNFYEKAP